ncbi:uroporphyrinogen decarboxylase [Sporobacter termitidis DSM 10068]|uniref:Uroporphyrinogen decarboxylase n=1 Tax=Sporobacter termitidis DSM 10068 TaxID=1123282 RepID=A0A1M5X5J2_9FIRM|nr:uroporphyrinogen decarboxylase family protein [Sporobacter termitidis]SHH95066.1 uroporphyrinogen decarboxylase [Sporobacter termitidis DSM 10068]
MNMYNWIEQVIYTERKKPLPILSFPAVQHLYVTMRELVADSNHQAIGMRAIADNYDMLAALSYMDLSVEAEAFGAYTVFKADEIPTIIGKLISTEAEAEALEVPEVGAGRTGENVETIRKAQMLINDRPVIAQCIGPFSLAGRLLNVNDIMLQCYENPELVHMVLKKAAAFITAYATALKKIGADGIIMAEPLAGLLSPQLIKEFSTRYVREIVGTLQDKHFIVIYHNCGGAVPHLMGSIMDTGCYAFHFGDAVDMASMLEKIPRNYLVMGNISPARVFNKGTAEQVRLETLKLLNQCGSYNNFVISSGCDIPPDVDLDNVNMFFKTVEGFYYRQSLRNAIS